MSEQENQGASAGEHEDQGGDASELGGGRGSSMRGFTFTDQTGKTVSSGSGTVSGTDDPEGRQPASRPVTIPSVPPGGNHFVPVDPPLWNVNSIHLECALDDGETVSGQNDSIGGAANATATAMPGQVQITAQ